MRRAGKVSLFVFGQNERRSVNAAGKLLLPQSACTEWREIFLKVRALFWRGIWKRPDILTLDFGEIQTKDVRVF